MAGAEFARSASGRYSVYNGETVSAYGFNFNGASTGLAAGGVSLGTPVVSGDHLNVTIGGTINSGSIVATVNSIPSLNNVNSNPTFAADGQTITAYGYNSQGNGVNNDRLNDDCAIWVWNLGAFVASTNITSPMMKMDGASNYYLSYGNGVPSMAVNRNGSVTQVDYSYNKFRNNFV